MGRDYARVYYDILEHNGAATNAAADAGTQHDADTAQTDTAIQYPITKEDITDVFLLTGQSNALAAWTHEGFNAATDAPHERVWAWTENTWKEASLYQNWDSGWPGESNRRFSTTPPSTNIIFNFAKAVAERYPNKVIGIVLESDSGKPLSFWNQNSQYSQTIERDVTAALRALPQLSTLSGILWHQGEADSNGIAEDVTGGTAPYHEAFMRLVSRWRDESWFGPSRAVIAGEVANDVPVNDHLNRLNTDGDPWTGCGNGQGLDTKDGYHFTASALRIMGRSYADIYFKMLDGTQR